MRDEKRAKLVTFLTCLTISYNLFAQIGALFTVIHKISFVIFIYFSHLSPYDHKHGESKQNGEENKAN